MKDQWISKSTIEELGASCLARRNENGKLEAIISLDNVLTVEARPQGEWIFDGGEWRCSACGQTPWYNRNPMESGYKFCPNCGAKMLKGESDVSE